MRVLNWMLILCLQFLFQPPLRVLNWMLILCLQFLFQAPACVKLDADSLFTVPVSGTCVC